VSRWFNGAAVEWVIFESPRGIPAGAKWTYVVVALHARATGCSAFPSVDLIATLTGRSERQVRRDLDDLEERGLLLAGDPKAVAHLRADQRPKVFDMPVSAREYIGRHRKPGSADSRGATMTPRTTGHHVTPYNQRGDISAVNGVSKTSERGVMVAPEELLKSSGKGVPPAPSGGAADDTPQKPASADDGAPLDAATELAKTKAYLATLNAGGQAAAIPRWRDPVRVAAEQASEARANREAAERAGTAAT
jgi:hypothetical protein